MDHDSSIHDMHEKNEHSLEQNGEELMTNEEAYGVEGATGETEHNDEDENLGIDDASENNDSDFDPDEEEWDSGSYSSSEEEDNFEVIEDEINAVDVLVDEVDVMTVMNADDDDDDELWGSKQQRQLWADNYQKKNMEWKQKYNGCSIDSEADPVVFAEFHKQKKKWIRSVFLIILIIVFTLYRWQNLLSPHFGYAKLFKTDLNEVEVSKRPPSENTVLNSNGKVLENEKDASSIINDEKNETNLENNPVVNAKPIDSMFEEQSVHHGRKEQEIVTGTDNQQLNENILSSEFEEAKQTKLNYTTIHASQSDVTVNDTNNDMVNFDPDTEKNITVEVLISDDKKLSVQETVDQDKENISNILLRKSKFIKNDISGSSSQHDKHKENERKADQRDSGVIAKDGDSQSDIFEASTNEEHSNISANLLRSIKNCSSSIKSVVQQRTNATIISEAVQVCNQAVAKSNKILETSDELDIVDEKLLLVSHVLHGDLNSLLLQLAKAMQDYEHALDILHQLPVNGDDLELEDAILTKITHLKWIQMYMKKDLTNLRNHCLELLKHQEVDSFVLDSAKEWLRVLEVNGSSMRNILVRFKISTMTSLL